MGDIFYFADTHLDMSETRGNPSQTNACGKFITTLEDLPGYRGIFTIGIYPEDKKFRPNNVWTPTGEVCTRNPYSLKVKHGYPKQYKMLVIPDKLIWVVGKDNAGDSDGLHTFLFKPQQIERGVRCTYYRRGDRAYDVTGISDVGILMQCHKDELNAKDYKPLPEGAYRRHLPKYDVQSWGWGREFDGKNVLALTILYPKMTYNEILNRLAVEGASVDANGIIHKAD